MSQLTYHIGDATTPAGAGQKSDRSYLQRYRSLGAGFVLAISRRWPGPEKSYRRWHAEGGDPPFELGQVQFVAVEDSLWVANLIGQHGIRQSKAGPPIRYDAVRMGLERVVQFCQTKTASAHMPRIGCGLAGVSTTVYDLR